MNSVAANQLVTEIDPVSGDSDSSIDVKTGNTAKLGRRERVNSIIQRFGSLSGMIRMAGVAAMVVAMCLFLIDGLNIVNDTQRFMSMLMLTGLLSAGGFILAFLLREQRGARAFFGLALLSVPVNFTVLGALIYSVFQFDALNIAYPSLAEWRITDIAGLGTTMLIALAALVPVSVLGVSVMARAGRGWLVTALLISSSFLMLPIRDSAWIAPIVAVMVVSLLFVIKRFGKSAVALKTPAGQFVQGLLFLPPAIMLVRSFWLYEITALSGLMVALTLYSAFRFFSQRIDAKGVLVGVFHWASVTTAFFAGLLAVITIPASLGGSFDALVFCLLFGALMLDLERRVQNSDMAEFMGIASAIIMSIAVVYHQLLFSTLLVFVLGLSVLAALIGSGVIQQKKEKLIIGVVALIGVAVLNAPDLVSYFVSTGWLGFASLGALAILIASLLERFGPLLSERLRHRFAR